MSGSAPLRPLTLLGVDAPACEGEECLVPDVASDRAADSSPAPPTDR
jgi:hypothetical protein